MQQSQIEVKFASMWNKGDGEIAADVVSSLKWNWEVPDENLKVKVENGWVTLEGILPWNFQKRAAQKSVHNVSGVRGIFNNIEIKSETHDNIEKSEIEHAISRNWAINDRDVHVAVSGNGVTLSGSVSSWYQKDEAERIAWNAPGVWTVDNQLEIVYDYLLVD
jgi:osmotically-inducible protein OsmY